MGQKLTPNPHKPIQEAQRYAANAAREQFGGSAVQMAQTYALLAIAESLALIADRLLRINQ